MLDERTVQDVGAALLRIALGVVFLAHSALLKLAIYGMPGTAQFFESLGLPSVLAYIVVCTEILGGSMLILGVQARWVALALTPILIGATWTHWPNGWLFTAANGGWEYPAYLTVMAIACFLIGEGRFVLVRSHPLPALDAGAAR